MRQWLSSWNARHDTYVKIVLFELHNDLCFHILRKRRKGKNKARKRKECQNEWKDENTIGNCIWKQITDSQWTAIGNCTHFQLFEMQLCIHEWEMSLRMGNVTHVGIATPATTFVITCDFWGFGSSFSKCCHVNSGPRFLGLSFPAFFRLASSLIHFLVGIFRPVAPRWHTWDTRKESKLPRDTHWQHVHAISSGGSHLCHLYLPIHLDVVSLRHVCHLRRLRNWKILAPPSCRPFQLILQLGASHEPLSPLSKSLHKFTAKSYSTHVHQLLCPLLTAFFIL